MKNSKATKPQTMNVLCGILKYYKKYLKISEKYLNQH